MKCSSCGYMVSEIDKQCPRCKSTQGSVATAVAPPKSDVRSGGGSTAVATRPAQASGALAVYTQCAWQRPDGRWLNSKEIAEIEQLARKYAVAKNSTGSASLQKLVAMVGFRRTQGDSVEAIRERVGQIGIPFGIFQAYANSLRQ